MTEKRFHYDKALEKIYDYNTCEDGIIESLDCFDACELLNKLNDENKQLHRIIIEDEKMIQSIYEELSKLRLIKKNLRKIKNQWNWIMESVDYD